jgi:hypothetical protein
MAPRVFTPAQLVRDCDANTQCRTWSNFSQGDYPTVHCNVESCPILLISAGRLCRLHPFSASAECWWETLQQRLKGFFVQSRTALKRIRHPTSTHVPPSLARLRCLEAIFVCSSRETFHHLIAETLHSNSQKHLGCASHSPDSQYSHSPDSHGA